MPKNRNTNARSAYVAVVPGPTEIVPRPISKAERRVGFLTVAATSSKNNNATTINSPPDARNNSLIVNPKSNRINLGNDTLMGEVVDEWDNHRPNNDAGKPISMNQFSSIKGIPQTTFKNYVYSDKSKRHKVDTSVEKKPILTKQYF